MIHFLFPIFAANFSFILSFTGSVHDHIADHIPPLNLILFSKNPIQYSNEFNLKQSLANQTMFLSQFL